MAEFQEVMKQAKRMCEAVCLLSQLEVQTMKTPEQAKKLVEALREDAEWAHANEWETPITLGDHLHEAANMIEHLDEENAGLDMLLTSAQSAAETWQRRAEAAERDIRAMLCEDSSTVLCKYCAHLKNDDCV